jgi:ankyrin repeat protein
MSLRSGLDRFHIECHKSVTFSLYCPRMNRDALIDAIRHRDAATLSRLIAEGCDIAGRTPSGNTMLHLAARINDVIITRILLTAGADAQAAGAGGKLPLDWARALGHYAVATVLESESRLGLSRKR